MERGGLTDRLRVACSAALDLLLPATCAACGRLAGGATDALVCRLCWSRLQPLPHPRCDRCGHPTWARPCRWCAALPAFVRCVRSVCWATGPALAIVHALKYDGWERVAVGMAARMSRLSWPHDVIAERTAIVPVPLAGVRERERGFNQSERIARALAPRWRVPVWDDVLVRARATATQTRLTPGARRHNVSGAFQVAPALRARLRGTHLVLVDDVVTTSATLNACAAALHAGGARIISSVTFGRAPAVGDRVDSTGDITHGHSRRH